MAVVLFEGWERWWDGTEAVAPGTAGHLRTFLTPAWGHRLPAADVVHGDLNITNVLTRGGAITGVVDWDHVGLGSRAADLTSLLFDWHRLRLAGERTTAPDGGERLVRRITQMVGEEGLRCTVTYGAIARLALTARRGRREEVESWRLVTEAILDSMPTWR